MLKKLFIAIALSVGLVAANGAANLTLVPEAQAFSLKGAAKKVGKGIKKGAKAVGREAKGVGKSIGRDLKRNGKAVGREVGRVGKSIGRDFKRNGKAVGRAAKKTGRFAKQMACPDFDGRGPGAEGPGPSDGGFCAVGRAVKKGVTKTGRAIGDTAKCVANGGCAKIGPSPGRPRVVDHR